MDKGQPGYYYLKQLSPRDLEILMRAFEQHHIICRFNTGEAWWILRCMMLSAFKKDAPKHMNILIQAGLENRLPAQIQYYRTWTQAMPDVGWTLAQHCIERLVIHPHFLAKFRKEERE